MSVICTHNKQGRHEAGDGEVLCKAVDGFVGVVLMRCIAKAGENRALIDSKSCAILNSGISGKKTLLTKNFLIGGRLSITSVPLVAPGLIVTNRISGHLRAALDTIIAPANLTAP